MGDGDDSTLQQAEAQETLLAVVSPDILDRHRVTAEHRFRVGEIETVLVQVGPPLGLVPLDSHQSIVTTNRSYGKSDG